MQINLQEDIEKLGNRGQVVEVAECYARNFILPRKLIGNFDIPIKLHRDVTANLKLTVRKEE